MGCIQRSRLDPRLCLDYDENAPEDAYDTVRNLGIDTAYFNHQKFALSGNLFGLGLTQYGRPETVRTDIIDPLDQNQDTNRKQKKPKKSSSTLILVLGGIALIGFIILLSQ